MKLKDYNILIVEDELISLEYLKQVLYSLRVNEIYEAVSADEALKIVKEHHIDLVYMDINIQGAKDGIACAALLNKEYFLPIIFTTAYGDTNTINEAREENMFGYLIKPFQPNDVEASTNVAIKMINKEKEHNTIDNQKEKEVIFINLNEEYHYNFVTKTLYFYKIPLSLTKKESEILDLLIHNINQNISYEYLKETIWQNKIITNSTIRDSVSRLKKKIPNLDIQNISNIGYIMKKS